LSQKEKTGACFIKTYVDTSSRRQRMVSWETNKLLRGHNPPTECPLSPHA